MIETLLLLLAAATSPLNAAQAAGLEAAHDYGSCVGMNAVLNSAIMRAIDEAIASAVDRCSAKRQAALIAVTASLESFGLSAVRAAQEAEQTIHETEQLMADKLRVDIAHFRRTGRPPTDASN
jgi:hypothetical protein